MPPRSGSNGGGRNSKRKKSNVRGSTTNSPSPLPPSKRLKETQDGSAKPELLKHNLSQFKYERKNNNLSSAEAESKDIKRQSSLTVSNDVNDLLGRIYNNKVTLKVEPPQIGIVNHLAVHSRNVVHGFQQRQLGLGLKSLHSKSVGQSVVSIVSGLQLYRTGSPFDRRCTALEWHPTNPNVIAVGSKGGDIILWDTENIQNETIIPGKGPGGSVQAIKFDPEHSSRVVTASIDGTVSAQDFQGRNSQVLLDTGNCYDYWYCSVDVNPRRRMISTGDNVGNVVLLSNEGRKIMDLRLHKQKVTHTEFSPREDWLLCTASTDQTTQLWDVRMIKDRKSALSILKHDKPVNSAYFSLTDGTRLLTTDQGNEIRVYQAPDFHLETTIQHPHRFFQHITPIKAYWHPLQDLVVVGRYPDPKFPGYVEGERRTIDVFDAATGNMECQLFDPAAPGIVSLNKFNHTGDLLASTMGVNILVWSRKEEMMERQQVLMDAMKKTGITPGRRPGGAGRRPRNGNDDDDHDLKKKKKTKSKSKADKVAAAKLNIKKKDSKH